MSFTEYLTEKENENLNHREATQKAIDIFKQAVDWLKGSVSDKPYTNNKDVKDILAKVLSDIGTLDTAITSEEEEEEVEEAPAEEAPAQEEQPTT
jgi:hypothetical protein